MNINKKKIYLNFIFLLINVLLLITDIEHINSIIMANILIYIIIFVNLKNGNIFSPISLFSVMYITAPASVYYLLLEGLENSHFIEVYSSYNLFFDYLPYTIFLFLIGYIAYAVGYFSFLKKSKQYYSESFSIDNLVLKYFIIIFMTITLVNFLYIVFSTTGNPLTYFRQMSVNRYIYTTELSTFGYNFGVFSIYLYQYYLLKNNKKPSIIFISSSMLMLIIKASAGRIFQTMATILIILGIFYTFSMITDKNTKYSKYILFTVTFGIIIYVFRAAGSFYFHGGYDTFIDAVYDIISRLTYYIFGRGNVVNIAIVPYILNNWESDYGTYLYGSSALSGLVKFFPFLKETFPSTSYLIKNLWFEDIIGGALPPTCIGELYINFGLIGTVIGMLIMGIISSILFNIYSNKVSFIKTIIYMHFVCFFILLFPKTDFSSFPFFEIFFSLLMFILVLFISEYFRRKQNDSSSCLR